MIDIKIKDHLWYIQTFHANLHSIHAVILNVDQSRPFKKVGNGYLHHFTRMIDM